MFQKTCVLLRKLSRIAKGREVVVVAAVAVVAVAVTF